jgi:hypothetical protein
VSDGTVLLDTNIFSAQLNPRSRQPALYRKHLVRARLAVPFQVVGEAQLVRRVGVLPVDDATVLGVERAVMPRGITVEVDMNLWSPAITPDSGASFGA